LCISVAILVAILVERSPVLDEDWDCGASRLFFAAKSAKKSSVLPFVVVPNPWGLSGSSTV